MVIKLVAILGLSLSASISSSQSDQEAGASVGEPIRDAGRNEILTTSYSHPVSSGGARTTKCAVGSEPEYFVPGGDPALIIGCAELSVSEKPVEFSVDDERIGRRDFACINPAYTGRGSPGIYIPATCTIDPDFGLDVLSAERPSQAVRKYEYVIWGVANQKTEGVKIKSLAGRSESAVFKADATITERLGITRPFAVFVIELPLRSACGTVKVTGVGPSATRVVRQSPKPKVCSEAKTA